MNFLDTATISSIMNLKSSLLIQESIAERQSEVIRKGFNYLSQPDNNCLYLADEVGLGKTYIALGVASLLRHFSVNPQNYQDVIVVPKENLQTKWEKEIRQFINNNYKIEDNRVKSVIGAPIGIIHVKETLEPITHDFPGYHLYRNTSFSFGLTYNNKINLKETLESRLTCQIAKDILDKAYESDYFYAENKSALKKLYAYLLSICNPPIELLIIDEGHNYKHGLGEGDDDVSDRNNVISRFMGIKGKSNDDKKIFDEFPDLKGMVKPKVLKLVILSATPRTDSLIEFRKQLDCFLPQHILSGMKKEEEIKSMLNNFLIRGKMEYLIGNKTYTRNECRNEHRQGNVEKIIDAAPLYIQDNEQALVLGLLQYNTIKHLNAKNNASFEIGMLAGFETFKIDQEKRTTEQIEYEEFRTRKTKYSQDSEILHHIINSYQTEFGCLPPHPKQDAIVNAAFDLMRKGEKSLIFVRRVASAYELERRLLDKWQDIILNELKSSWRKRQNSKDLDELIENYDEYKNNRALIENLDNIFNGIIKRLISKTEYNLSFIVLKTIDENEIARQLKIGLYYIFNNKEIPNYSIFKDLLSKQVNLTLFKTDIIDLSYSLLQKSYDKWKQMLLTDENNDFQEEDEDSYFFHKYFLQPHARSFRKSRIYNNDWFDLNYYLLNKHFKISSFNIEQLKQAQINDPSNIKEVQDVFLKHVKEEEYSEHFINEEEFPALLIKNTLITELIINKCETEFKEFLFPLTAIRSSEILKEIKILVTILKSILRNGSGFLPLFIADKSNKGDFIQNYIDIISEPESVFHDVLKEIKSIIRDYQLIRAVNFPDGEDQKEIETKLIYQSPVKGMSGMKKNKSKVAAQFRMPGFPYILITTDIFREGEDLHTYCQNIYHYGIAWNCSDMEQRTGRIDRINSQSHRKLCESNTIQFNDQLHVFYPYLRKTLEVNQVNKLFNGINNFVKAFDIIDTIEDDGIASTKDAITRIPDTIKVQPKSRFEHHLFTGCKEAGTSYALNTLIGQHKEDIESFLTDLNVIIESIGAFHYGPEIDYENFTIKGDQNLINRGTRRGPFRVLMKNDLYPGKFKIEVSSYLFKISSKAQRALKEHSIGSLFEYELINIDDFHAISLDFQIEGFDFDDFKKKLLIMIEKADILEEKITVGDDLNIFG